MTSIPVQPALPTRSISTGRGPALPPESSSMIWWPEPVWAVKRRPGPSYRAVVVLTVTGTTPGRLWSAEDEEGIDWALAGRRHPAHDLGALHDQVGLGGLKGRGNLIGREPAIWVGAALALGAVPGAGEAVVAHDQEPAAGCHGRSGAGVDGHAFVDRQVQIDDDHEIERPRQRRPIEQVALEPIDPNAGGVRLRLAVCEADRRPVDRGRPPALLRKPDCVGAAA